MPVKNCLTGIKRNCTNLNASGMQWIIGQACQQDNTVKQLLVLAQLRGIGAVLHKVRQCGKCAQLTLCQEVRSIRYLQLLQQTFLHLKLLLLLYATLLFLVGIPWRSQFHAIFTRNVIIKLRRLISPIIISVGQRAGCVSKCFGP